VRAGILVLLRLQDFSTSHHFLIGGVLVVGGVVLLGFFFCWAGVSELVLRRVDWLGVVGLG
jgi:hypothetical protein